MLRNKVWWLSLVIQYMLGLNAFGLGLTTIGNFISRLQMRSKAVFYDTALFTLTLATFLTMSNKCIAERSAYVDNERLFAENCSPSNAFFLFYLLMCIMWIIKPMENFFLLISPTLGS